MSSVTASFLIAIACYIAAAACFFVNLWKGSERSGTWAARLLSLSAVTHLAFLGINYAAGPQGPLTGIHGTLSVLSLLVTVGYLGTMRTHRLTVLGAFIAPLSLLLLLGAGLRSEVAQVPPEVRSAMLPLHVSVNVLGIVAFALAFAVALAYMIQERLLRKKQVGGVFQRLPALDVLDRMGLRLVTIGFPLFTIGVVSGSMWARELGGGTPTLSAGQGFGVLAWLFFGAVLIARAAAGWRGRRAAIGTMLGFACAMAALLGYVIQGAGGT